MIIRQKCIKWCDKKSTLKYDLQLFSVLFYYHFTLAILCLSLSLMQTQTHLHTNISICHDLSVKSGTCDINYRFVDRLKHSPSGQSIGSRVNHFPSIPSKCLILLHIFQEGLFRDTNRLNSSLRGVIIISLTSPVGCMCVLSLSSLKRWVRLFSVQLQCQLLAFSASDVMHLLLLLFPHNPPASVGSSS